MFFEESDKMCAFLGFILLIHLNRIVMYFMKFNCVKTSYQLMQTIINTIKKMKGKELKVTYSIKRTTDLPEKKYS